MGIWLFAVPVNLSKEKKGSKLTPSSAAHCEGKMGRGAEGSEASSLHLWFLHQTSLFPKFSFSLAFY